MSTNTGGPAFPWAADRGDMPGMTLRDYFAAKWMQAYVANPETPDIAETELAEFAYQIADAMLKARAA
jgi:hypothetical protein